MKRLALREQLRVRCGVDLVLRRHDELRDSLGEHVHVPPRYARPAAPWARRSELFLASALREVREGREL